VFQCPYIPQKAIRAKGSSQNPFEDIEPPWKGGVATRVLVTERYLELLETQIPGVRTDSKVPKTDMRPGIPGLL